MTLDSLHQSLTMYADARQCLSDAKNDLDGLTVPYLRNWRTARNLSLRDAAELLGVSYSFLSKVETGKSGYPITAGLAEKLLENWEGSE